MVDAELGGRGALALAWDRLGAGRADEAEAACRGVLAEDGSDPEAMHLLGVIGLRRGEAAGAAVQLERAAGLDPSSAAIRARLAEARYGQGDHAGAVAAGREALVVGPDDPTVRCVIGLALHGLGRPGEAIDEYRRALALRPGDAVALSNQGIALRDLGRHDEALESFARAAELDPGSAASRTNLGQMLLLLGRPDEAIGHAEAAARLGPDRSAFWNNLGNVRMALGRSEEARAAFVEAIRLEPGLAMAHARMGEALLRESRLDEAFPLLRQACWLDPTSPIHWELLGELHNRAERYPEAIDCWERALETGPGDRAWPHMGIGWSLLEEGESARAEAHYRAAAAIAPAAFEPLFELGSLYEERGEAGQAEAAFRSALRVDPAAAVPLARLATMLGRGLPDADLSTIEERLADPSIGAEPRARLLFGLGHSLDARGDYPRAAASFREANALQLSLAGGELSYDPAESDRILDGMVSGFDAAFFARVAGGGSESRRPVFLLGLPRTGSSLLEQILASHPKVHGAGELRLGVRWLESIPEVVGRPGSAVDAVGALDAAAIRGMAVAYDARLGALGGPAERVVDKMANNYWFLGLLAAMFPRATFLESCRDARDVSLSCWMTDFRSIRWASSPEYIAHQFRAHRRLMDHWRSAAPVTVHEVHYEETVADPEGVARRLVDAIGLEWDPACLEFHRTSRSVRTASVNQVRRPIYSGSVARWRRYESEAADLFRAIEGPETPRELA